MPLYEYRCAICGAKEEKLQAISAADQHDCPECEAPAGMKRQLSVAAFSLAGGGWYKQGYGGAPAKKDAPAEGGEPAAKPAGDAPAAAPATATPTPAAPKADGCGGGCACS